MKTQKYFKPTTLALALASLFPVTHLAYAQEVAELISPEKSEIAIQVKDYNAVNSSYRQYDGVNQTGANSSINIDLIKRNEEGKWIKVQSNNLGLSTQEFGASYDKQGDWSLGIDYNQIPRYAPYAVSTSVKGVGTDQITQPNRAAPFTSAGKFSTSPSLYDVTLKTEREITTLTANKFLSDELKFSFTFKNEDKTGSRMNGIRGNAATAVNTTSNLYAGFLFTPEPVNHNHTQLEAVLDYATNKYQISAGVYSSFFKNKNPELGIIGGTNTAVYSGTSNGCVAGQDCLTKAVNGKGVSYVPGISALALAPDNSFHQFYANGAYNFTKDTRGTLKVAYSEGRQTDSFIAGQSSIDSLNSIQPGIGNLGSNLYGKVETTDLFASITSRITKDFRLLASWRYEDRQDKTPIRATAFTTALVPGSGTATTGTYTPTYFYNNPESHTANWSKLEADYNMGAGYGLTVGLDQSQKKSQEWERKEVTENTSRVALRKSMTEDINGSLLLASSDRKGSEWGIAATPLTIYPAYLADRKRDKVRGMIDWVATENLNLQFSYESYRDDYKQSTYGLDKGEGHIYAVDGVYAINDNWKLNAWYSLQIGETRQEAQGAACANKADGTVDETCVAKTPRQTAVSTWQYVQWNSLLKSNSDQLGLGITGKIKKFDVGAQYLYTKDTNRQDSALGSNQTCLAQNTTTGACTSTGNILGSMGILPDTHYTQNTLRLYASYPLEKNTRLRFDYIYDIRKMDDYTWNNWVYADGTKVFVKPEQATQIVGITLIHNF